MFRKSGIGLAVFAVLALTVSIAAAGNAHFVGTPNLSTSGNNLIASGKVAGLGNIDQIHVTVSGEAACINPGNKKPQAANKQTVSGDGDFPVQNGKANFSLSASATFQPDCTPPMSVQWSNVSIVVTDPAGNVLATFP